MEKINELKRTFSQRLKKLTTNKGEENQDLASEDCAESRCVNWSIENLDVCPLGIGEFLDSPPFYSGLSNGTKWIMRLYPSGRNEENSGKVGLFICRVSSEAKCRFKCQFTLQNTCLREGYFYFESTLEDLEEHGTDDFFFAEDLSALGIMKIECNLLIKYADRAEKFNLSNKASSPICTLSSDLKKLFSNGKFSDITLNCGKKHFAVHKAVLAARSNVFAAMFDHSMEESQTSVVNIDDVEASVMSDFLQFLYTNAVDNLTINKAIALFKVADKYSVEELRNLCVRVMLTKLCVENVFQIATLADMHSEPKLKAAANHVFRKYKRQVFEKKEWETLISTRPQLASEILRTVTTDLNTSF